MIFLQNVAKFFNGKPLFQGVNVSIHRGDRIGIVGPNGAGKSTLLGMMEGVVTPDEGEVSIEKRIRLGVLRQELIEGTEGHILEEVMNVSDEVRNVREDLARLEQELNNLAEFDEKAEALLEEHGRLHHLFEAFDGYTLEARARKVLHGLGFTNEDAGRRWKEFSGGWRMRVALAKILLAEPDALLLDEPTNHLDLESLLWVEDYLASFKGAIVLVSHDRAFLNRLVDKIIEVDRSKVTSYTGNFDEYEKNREMQDEIQLAAYKSQQEKIQRIQKFIDQNRVKARTASRVQSRIKMMEKLDRVEPPRRTKTVKFTFPQPPSSGRRVLEIQGLVKRFGSRTIYDGFDFNLDRGEKVGIVGPNGAGKSTLLKIIADVLAHEGGTVRYGHQVEPGYFAQHQAESLSLDRTALEEAASAAPRASEQELRNLLGAFLFSGDDVQKKVKVLSGGEKSRLSLTKLLLAPPNLLLMDEPTNHLDITSCEVLEKALQDFEGTIVLITHDRRLMNRICTGILEIEGGKTEYYLGNYDDYQYKKNLDAKENRPEAIPTPPPLPKAGAPKERGARKERKRKEAEARSAMTRKKAPLVEELRHVEGELEAKQKRRGEIHDILADPANYENKELVLPLMEEEPALAREIKALEARWEELQVRMEELESQSL
ncbi:MAG: ABC-F family ATP-binding cassette domain-containing protein [Thermodesulfobacteriota bacterium]